MKELQQYYFNTPSSQSIQKLNWIDSEDINKITVLQKKNKYINRAVIQDILGKQGFDFQKPRIKVPKFKLLKK